MHDVLSEMQTFYRETASKSKGGGWRAVGEKIGKSGAYAWQIVNGQRPVTEEIAVAWMLSNGWEPKLYTYPACPGCGGEPHVAREGCHGYPNAVAVMVKPDAQEAIALIDQWLADDNGHDEAVWPVIEKALRDRRQPAKPARQRPNVRRPWMGAELSTEMDKAGVTDEAVRWLVKQYIYVNELAGKAGQEGPT